MRVTFLVAATAAVTLAGCATVKDARPPKGVGAKQEASDRAQCKQVGVAARSNPKMKEFVEEGMKAQALGSFLGGGLIGLAVAAAQQDKIRANWAQAWEDRHNWECLKKKGYTIPGVN